MSLANNVSVCTKSKQEFHFYCIATTNISYHKRKLFFFFFFFGNETGKLGLKQATQCDKKQRRTVRRSKLEKCLTNIHCMYVKIECYQTKHSTISSIFVI
jgi:hypothetical protein